MSPKRLMTAKQRRAALKNLCDHLQPFPPDRFGSYEPLMRKPLCDHFDEAIGWDQELLWMRSKPGLAGDLSSAWRPQFLHSYASMRTNEAIRDQDTLIGYLDSASEDLLADYAVLHVIGECDLPRGGHQGSGVLSAGSLKPWDISLIPTTHRLIGGLPDVYWSTVFGRPYVALIGRERLLSCPESDIAEYGYGGIRVTSRLPIHAARTEPEAFEAWRERVREHIGREFFFDAPTFDLEARVPEFAWLEEP